MTKAEREIRRKAIEDCASMCEVYAAGADGSKDPGGPQRALAARNIAECLRAMNGREEQRPQKKRP